MTELPTYPVGDHVPSGTARIPTSLRVARWTAVAQSLLGVGAAGWLWRQAAAISPAGEGDWSQIPQAVFRLGGIVAATAAVAIAVPAVLLAQRGPAPRIALIVVEIVVGAPLLLALPSSLGATGQYGLKSMILAGLVGVVTTLVATCRPSARTWSADRWRD